MASSICRIEVEHEQNKFGKLREKYFLSIAAAAVAETVTYPLDIVKTRLQIHGEEAAKGMPHDTRGFFGTAMGIVKNEGVMSLFRGIPPAIYRHFIYSGCRMTIYEGVRDSYLKGEDATGVVWKSLLTGVAAGSIGQFLASPTDLVKVQMQAEGRRKLQGLPPRFDNTWDAWRKIVKAGGIRGLWSGWGPNVMRAAVVNLGDLTTYDRAKRMILTNTSLKDDYFTHSLASGCSGFVAAILGTPADVMRTRVMNQPRDEMGRGTLYRSATDCLMKTVKNEGFFALYKGFLPIWARMAPWSFTFWVSYEEFRRLAGVGSF